MTSDAERVVRRYRSRARGPGRPADRDADQDLDQDVDPLADVTADRERADEAERVTAALLEDDIAATADDPVATTPGRPFSRRSPYLIGLFGALGLFTAWGLIRVLGELTEVLSLVVVALFLALGLEPAVNRFLKWGLARGWSVLAVVLIGVALIAGFVWIVVPPVVAQANELVGNTPDYVAKLLNSQWFQDANDRWHISDTVIRELKAHANQATVLAVLGGVLGLTTAVVDGVIQVVTTIILTILFLATLPQIKTAAYSLVPASRRTRAMYLGEEILERVGAYILGQVVVAVVNALFCYALLLVLHLPFATILAITIGVLALIPIVGTLVGGTLVVAVAATHGFTPALIALAYYVTYHLVETYVIGPRIMRRAVEVPPLVTIVAVLAGSAVAGVLGALMAIPVVAGILLVMRHVLLPRQQAR